MTLVEWLLSALVTLGVVIASILISISTQLEAIWKVTLVLGNRRSELQ